MFARRDFIALAGAALALRAHAQGAPASSLTYGQSVGVLTLDPVHGSYTLYPAGSEAALCLYDGLLTFAPDMTIVPQLAESWAMADDLKSCTLKLRAGARFHDGTPVDAAAVKFNIERLMDRQRNPTNRPLWDPVAGVETPDAATVVLHLSQPFAQLPNSLAHVSGALVSPAAVAKLGEDGIAKNPVGAGPYRMASFDPGQQLVLEAFDGYWGGRPKTVKLILKTIADPSTRVAALRTGAADVIDSVPVALVGGLKDDPHVEIIHVPGLRPIGFVINLTRPPLADLRVRQALNLAIPVETIASKVFFGYARAPDSPLAFNTEGYARVSRLVYDPGKAKALLEAAGFGPEKPLELAMFVSQGLFPSDVSVGEVVANALAQVGVKVAITKIEAGSYWDAMRQDRANIKWDIAMFGFNPANASGLYHLASLFKSNKDDAARPDVWNLGRYRNPEVDRLLEAAGTEADRKQAAADLAKAQAIIWNDAPYIWLQINENVSAVKRPVSGVEVWPILFTNVRHAAA
ncbi:MAG TPA: ABC transporter substrate-binding protein [Acetobacteraceae bacterium]